MKIYRNWLGRRYEIPDDQVEAFESRRRPMLIAKIVIQVIVLAGLLVLAWTR